MLLTRVFGPTLTVPGGSRRSGRFSSERGPFQGVCLVTLTVGGITRTIERPGDAAPVVRELLEADADSRAAWRDSKIRLGWVLCSVRERFPDMTFDAWLGTVGMKRRSAYHVMRLARELGDSEGKFSSAKYAALCLARKKEPAADVDAMTLRAIEVQTGLRSEDGVELEGAESVHQWCTDGNAGTDGADGTDGESVHQWCTLPGLALRVRSVADLLDSGRRAWGRGRQRGLVDAVAALEVMARRLVV